jgi:hemolysin activation/secretion protein
MRLRNELIFAAVFTVTLVCVFQSAVYAQTAYEPVRFSVSEFIVEGDNPIGDRALQILKPYLGEQSGLEGISAAADELERALINAGYSFHRVSLPPQELTAGSVTFNIVRFTVGAVHISGNQYFDRENIEHSLPGLSPGSTPNTKELSRSLKLANTHASKNLVLKFKEGDQPDSIDADITVKDQNPQIFFLTLDNTGSEDTEEIRSTLGYQYGNLFNRDHALTATLTMAPEDPDAATQIGVNYHMPLYSHGANLDFLLSDSEVNSGVVAQDVEISGKGSVFGVTYTRPLLSDTNFNHQWSLGYQYKNFENVLDTSGSTLDSDVISSPLELGYGFSYTLPQAVFSGGLALVANVESGGSSLEQDYANARSGAEPGWSAVRYSLAYDRSFGSDWLFHLGLSGQQSDDLLISGEQFGVGGASTLRGFEERSVTGDKGYQSSLEVWMPPWVGMRWLVFTDMASVELNDGDSYDLSSYGLGLRWSWKQQLSLSLDYGVINKGGGPDTSINQDGDDKAHFNLVYRF